MKKRPYTPPRVQKHEDLRRITLFTKAIGDSGGGSSDRNPHIHN